MEEFENEYDKGIYWVIFFIGLLIIGLIGHYFVFSYSNEKKEDNKVIEEKKEENIDSYKGVWQLFEDEDDLYPVQELCINYIDGATITFDYLLKDGYKFESQTADLISNSASFEIYDRIEGKISGKIIFKNNKVFLAITSSDIEDITPGTIEFNLRVDDSLLN